MTATARSLLITLALTTLMTSAAYGQQGDLEPRKLGDNLAVSQSSPVPVTAYPPVTLSAPLLVAPAPAAGYPSYHDQYEDRNGSFLKGDPLLDASPWQTPGGWFAALEVDALVPHVKNELTAPVTVGGVTNQVALGGAGLGWTAAPHVELGYRLDEAAGDLLVSYWGVTTSGSGTTAGPISSNGGPTAPLTSRFAMNVIDLDYACREPSLGPLWDMKWRAGVRIATVFFDSAGADPALSERATNSFVGAGIHGALNLNRQIGDTRFNIISQIDGAVVLGGVEQNFSESIPGTGSAIVRHTQTQPAPTLGLRLGVDWSPAVLPDLRLSAGYRFEGWWTVGETFGPETDVIVQGIFIRAEWRY